VGSLSIEEVRMRQPLNTMLLRTPATDRSLSFPFSGAYGPGVRKPTDKNKGGIHQGWDLLAPVGTTAYSIAPGKVCEVYRNLDGYGRAVVIQFGFRGRQLYAIYGHLSAVSVKKNQPVNEGDPIARTGASGNAGNTAPHLHFGIMTSPAPHQGMAYFISPGHLLGYTRVRGLTTDDHCRLDMG
jgi:murein DD-endopeptidase MepM/ murein hydrolase activator NlpD